MSEKVEGELKVFSSILLQDYIRLMTAAVYIQTADTPCGGVKFKISADTYEKMCAEPLKAPLIGLTLVYDAATEVLTGQADEAFIRQYDNKIMNSVALKYFEDYRHRYASYINYLEN